MTGRVDEKGRKNELRIFQAMSEDLEGWGGLRPSRSRYRILEQALPSMLAHGTIHLSPHSLFSITFVGATTPALLTGMRLTVDQVNSIGSLATLSTGRVDNDIEGKSRHISWWRASEPLCAVRPRMPLPKQSCRFTAAPAGGKRESGRQTDTHLYLTSSAICRERGEGILAYMLRLPGRPVRMPED